MTEKMAYQTRMTINSVGVEFVTHGIKQTIDIEDDDGIRGTRSKVLERTAQGLIHVAGPITFHPTPVELALILPLVCQNSTGTNLTDSLQDVTIVIDTQTKLNTFVGRFTKMKLSGKPGKMLELTVDFVGKTCVVGSGGSLSTTPDITVRPYMMQDIGSGITIGGTVYAMDEFDFTIDNHIDPTFMGISQVATDLEPTDRTVSLGLRVKYTTAEDALLVLAMAGPVLGTPLTASVAFTDGSNSVTLSFGALVAKSETVTNQGKKTKLRLPLNYDCYRVGTTLEVVPVLV